MSFADRRCLMRRQVGTQRSEVEQDLRLSAESSVTSRTPYEPEMASATYAIPLISVGVLFTAAQC